MLKYLRLPFNFDVQKLQQEVQALQKSAWKLHYNKKHYNGEWSIIPLQSLNGDSNNLFSVQTTSNAFIHYAPTVFLEQCTYIREILQGLDCEKTSIRLMQLAAGANIKPHADYDMSFEEGEVRLHIPVITDAAVKFFLLEEQVVMKEGECWYLNLSLTHAVENNSKINRIHLVIDCKVNDWVKNIFEAPGNFKKEITEQDTIQKFSDEDHFRIIQELRNQNNAAALQLADELAIQLNTNDAGKGTA